MHFFGSGFLKNFLNHQRGLKYQTSRAYGNANYVCYFATLWCQQNDYSIS